MRVQDLYLNWLGLALIAVALHGLYLSLILFLRKGISNKLLAGLLLMITVRVFDYLFYLTGFNVLFPHTYGIGILPTYLIGPLYFLFVRSGIQREFAFKWYDVIHFLPATYFLLSYFPAYLASASEKLARIEYIMSPDRVMEFDEFLWSQLFIGQILIYLIVVERDLLKVRIQTMLKNMKVFNRTFAGFLILNVCAQLLAIQGIIGGVETEYVLIGLMAVLIHVLGYYVINSAGFKPEIRTNGDKYKTSPLGHEEMENLQVQLVDYFESEQPHTKTDLKISDVSKGLNVPAHHLSQVINQRMHTTFHDFVNKYRIDDVKKKLKDPQYQHYKLLSVAFDCGFSNKTSFNRSFKRITGKTPSEYVKSLE